MCDYSLMSIPNRLAAAGEELVTHRFHTGSLGLAAPEPKPAGFWAALKRSFSPQVTPAVCIPPGARLTLRDIPVQLRREIGVNPIEEVTFTQTTASDNNYRDAVRFANGREVRLQELCEGMRVRVESLSSHDGVEPVWEQRPELIWG
jgi:hypothetical protein